MNPLRESNRRSERRNYNEALVCFSMCFAVNYRGSLGFGRSAVLSLPGNIGTQDVRDVQVEFLYIFRKRHTRHQSGLAVRARQLDSVAQLVRITRPQVQLLSEERL
jgi:hypothetical protein